MHVVDVRIYDAELNFLGVIEDHSSLLWNRKFYESGTFQMYCPVTAYNIKLCSRGNLIAKRDSVEAGVIEYVQLELDREGYQTIKASGRFLSSYMDRRLVRPKINFTGKVEEAMRKILSDIEYPLPLVELGELHGFTERITFQATYKSLLDTESKLSKGSNIGFRFTPDFSGKRIIFDTYKGVDHSVSQSENSRVTFSDGFGSMTRAQYYENDELLKNVVYVGGQGEGEARVFVTVGDDTLTGLERRELMLDAADVDNTDLSDEQYRNALRTRGNNKLKERVVYASFECSVLPEGNYSYKRDYDLGDFVTVIKENWGVSADFIISEVMEVYEHGAMTITPVFGDPIPTTIDWRE